MIEFAVADTMKRFDRDRRETAMNYKVINLTGVKRSTSKYAELYVDYTILCNTFQWFTKSESTDSDIFITAQKVCTEI